jgi:hypothetical protein
VQSRRRGPNADRRCRRPGTPLAINARARSLSVDRGCRRPRRFVPIAHPTPPVVSPQHSSGHPQTPETSLEPTEDARPDVGCGRGRRGVRPLPAGAVPHQPAHCSGAPLHLRAVRQAIPAGLGPRPTGPTRVVPHGEPHPLAPTARPPPLAAAAALRPTRRTPRRALRVPLRPPHAGPPAPPRPPAPRPGPRAAPHRRLRLGIQYPQRLPTGPLLRPPRRPPGVPLPLPRWAGPLRVGNADEHRGGQGAAAAQGGRRRVQDPEGRVVRPRHQPQLLRRDGGVAGLRRGGVDARGLGVLPLHLRQPRAEGQGPPPLVRAEVPRRVPGVAQGVHPLHLLGDVCTCNKKGKIKLCAMEI